MFPSPNVAHSKTSTCPDVVASVGGVPYDQRAFDGHVTVLEADPCLNDSSPRRVSGGSVGTVNVRAHGAAVRFTT